ncbi:DUF447 domain-containing protein [Methanocaldococcus indicus]|uniref:DUF447 domain-containing protein n=1 Tax=Methanocaldococcus indicus TaxID=213231 RepID=UPI003C6CC675
MIYETVVVTKLNNRLNKAPIGTYIKDKKVRMKIFEGSHTYENLLNQDYFSVNVVEPIKIAEAVLTDDDEYLFYRDIPFVKGYYSIFYKVVSRKIINREDKLGKSKILLIEGEEIDRIYFNREIKPYCRADGLIVEMAILYSRRHLKDIEKDILELYKIIKKVGSKEHKNLAEKFVKEMLKG